MVQEWVIGVVTFSGNHKKHIIYMLQAGSNFSMGWYRVHFTRFDLVSGIDWISDRRFLPATRCLKHYRFLYPGYCGYQAVVSKSSCLGLLPVRKGASLVSSAAIEAALEVWDQSKSADGQMMNTNCKHPMLPAHRNIKNLSHSKWGQCRSSELYLPCHMCQGQKSVYGEWSSHLQ